MPLTQGTCHAVFTDRPVDAETATKILSIRHGAETYAYLLLDLCPNSADKTTALRSLREAMLWALQSLTLRGDV